ncbi:relaxase/mobilization nuclease domain-containing protein [Undibacterium sp. SXout11W]|uniref:relaxase/mobilization nuclease domain-containing protein n=1 Tax=Undibacterium sp. SXout11W TaxID=3413050 RepID=UPI003BF4588D
MKGMQRISRGSGFLGVLAYVLNREAGKENGRLIGGNLSANSPQDLAKEFGAIRRLRPEIKKPVWHNSLRLPAGEKLNDLQWNQIADNYMQAMGFDDSHPRVYVMHDDKNGQHIHIVASRIDLSGALYLGQNENLKSTKIIEKLEKKHALVVTKGVDRTREKAMTSMPATKRIKKKEREKSLRTGVEPPRERLQILIDAALERNPNASQFAQFLTGKGVKVTANIAATGKMNGFSFSLDGVAFSGSKLGDKYKWSSLLKRGLTFDPAVDVAGLAAYKSKSEVESDQNIDTIEGSYAFYLIKFLNQKRHQNGIEYRWQNGSAAFFDSGSAVQVIGKSTAAKITAMLELAHQKGWKTIKLSGSAEFKKIAIAEAIRQGIRISNPELQQYMQTLTKRPNADQSVSTSQFVSGNVRANLSKFATELLPDEEENTRHSSP